MLIMLLGKICFKIAFTSIIISVTLSLPQTNLRIDQNIKTTIHNIERDRINSSDVTKHSIDNKNTINSRRKISDINVLTNVSIRTANGTPKIVNILPVINTISRKDNTNTPFVFPDDLEKPRFAPVIPPECKGRRFCHDIPNYPESYIAERLTEFDKDFDQTVSEDIEISERFGADGDKNELCEVYSDIATPRAGLNEKNQWVTIVNQKELNQSFITELCRDKEEAAPCNPVAQFPLNIVATCEQKYVLKRLKAFNDKGVIYVDKFYMPSCCSCVYRDKYSLK